MPLLLSTNELAPNMRLCRPVHTGRDEVLSAGHVLTDADVATLRRSCPGANVLVADPMLDEMVAFGDDSRDQNVTRNAKGQLFAMLSGVWGKLPVAPSLDRVGLDGLHEAVAAVVSYIHDNPVAAAILGEHADSDHYLSRHAANVFYLSLALGHVVRGYVQQARRPASGRWDSMPTSLTDLTPLALAALFSDISLRPFAHHYHTCASLTREQREQIRRHPDSSGDMLPKGTPPSTERAVRLHHESFDGSGYPYGLAGEEVPIFARILRICSAFDAATTASGYTPAMSPVRVLAEMTLDSFARFYDPLLLKVFSRLIQPYPIGAQLRLNCGRGAVVIRHDPKDPFRPVVVIAFDDDGSRLPVNRVEGPCALAQHPELQIRSFCGEDVSDLYNDKLARDEPLVLSDFSTLFESEYP